MRRLSSVGVALALVLGPGATLAVDDGSAWGRGAFEATGSMSLGRYGHDTASLPDGRVLVMGGEPEGRGGKRVEVLDPTTGTFSRTGSMAKARFRPGVAALRDGRVLVVGGQGPGGVARSAEIWDPESGQFAQTGRLKQPRSWIDAVELPDGRVFIAGGAGDRYVQTIETWDPESGRFQKVGKLPERRALHTTTLLSDGRPLIIGGLTENKRGHIRGALTSALIFDPTTGSLSTAGTMGTARSHHTATLLPDGRVLVVGGDDWNESQASAEVWDPSTGDFTKTGSMAVARSSHSATALPDGRVLVAGGLDADGNTLATSEVWDPSTGEFSPSGPLLEARSHHSAERLPDGRVIVIGGGAEMGLRTAEVWDPTAVYEGPAPAASLALAACATASEELTTELLAGFPSTIRGSTLEAMACRGSDWLAMHDPDEPATSATIERTNDLLDATGKTIGDLAVATAHHEPQPGQAVTVTALRVDGVRATDLVEPAIPLLLGIERAGIRHRSTGRSDLDVIEVRDETVAGSEPTTIYSPMGDTLWLVTAPEPRLVGEIVEALPGPGGRFESPALGVAITFPDDYQVRVGPERVGRNDDMGAGAIEWEVAGGGASSGEGGGCGLRLYRPSDLTAQQALKQLSRGGKKAPKPEVLDGGLLRLAGPGTFFGGDIDTAVYALGSDGAVAVLMCLANKAPADLWLPIAESIELFPPDGAPPNADAEPTLEP